MAVALGIAAPVTAGLEGDAVAITVEAIGITDLRVEVALSLRLSTEVGAVTVTTPQRHVHRRSRPILVRGSRAVGVADADDAEAS